jgi:hypothetical protein
MDLSQFTVKIGIIFAPGLLSLILIQYLTVFRIKSIGHYLLFSFILGITAYVVFSGVYASLLTLISDPSTVGLDGRIDIWNKLLEKESKSIPHYEITATGFISFTIGITLSYLLNIGQPLKIFRRLGLTTS